MQCRACLKTNCKLVTRLDEHKIRSFNLITDLCIHKEDNLPQQLCNICARDLEFCIEFREKCISSNYILTNSILASALTSIDGSKIISKIKQEDNLEYDEIKYSEINKQEDTTILKSEYNDLENNETLQSEDNFIYEYIPDFKTPNIDNNTLQTPVSSHETAREITTKSTRKLAPRSVKKEINMSDKKQPAVAKFYCGLCAEMIEKDKLCDHVKTHESNNHCGICSSQLKDWETMLYHRISHLQKPNIMCHICLKIFQNSVSLEYHYNMKHLDKVKNAAKCRECNRNYFTLRNLWKHTRTMHNTNKTYQCKECSMSFRNTNALRYHRFRAHLIRTPKVLNCNKCDYKTKNESALSLHKLRMHTAEKASCKLCKAVFKNESRLELHKCKFSDPTICPVCGIIIEVPKKMKRHLESHSDERKYKCDRCDATYKTHGALRVHLNKHDGIRAHKCEHCSKTFWSQTTLKKHRRVHTGERPYVCKVCNKGFSANHNLKVHMRVHGVFNLIKKKGAEDDFTENVQECNKNSPI